MRFFLNAIVVLSMLLGMHGRFLAADPCETNSQLCSHGHDCSQDAHSHDDDHNTPIDHSHDDDTPKGHHPHNHGCFCTVMPLIDHREDSVRLHAPCFSLSRFGHEPQNAPEGPFLSEDKPPLI